MNVELRGRPLMDQRVLFARRLRECVRGPGFDGHLDNGNDNLGILSRDAKLNVARIGLVMALNRLCAKSASRMLGTPERRTSACRPWRYSSDSPPASNLHHYAFASRLGLSCLKLTLRVSCSLLSYGGFTRRRYTSFNATPRSVFIPLRTGLL